jgi:hypothetical protein
MNAFEQKQEIALRGVALARQIFREMSVDAMAVEEQLVTELEGRVVTRLKGPLTMYLQCAFGDLFFKRGESHRHVCSVEVKTEQRYVTGNLFLETWSNRSRLTQGWMVSMHADLLCYVFLDVERAFILGMPRLQNWAYREGGIYRFDEKLCPVDQLNDTWGRCVPIHVLRREVGLREWDLRKATFGPTIVPLEGSVATARGAS